MQRTAIVTGAAQGIGRSIARKFAENSFRLVLIDKDAAPLADLTAELSRGGAEVAPLVGNVSDEKLPGEAVDLALKKFQNIGILVNNAGMPRSPQLTDLARERWDQQVAVNLTGPMEMTKAVLPEMMRRKWGRIINISSIYGLVAVRASSSYAVTKAALLGLTRSTAADYGPYGITSNAIAPGAIKTDRAAAAMPERPRWSRQVLLNGSPIRRWGTPQEIAHAVAFFASEEASFINGQVLAVDGGWSTTRFWPDEIVEELP